MPKLIPKDLPEESWQRLESNRQYAVRINPDETVYFRFGQGQGIILSFVPNPAGRIINSIDFESGDPTMVGRLQANIPSSLGRTSECTIKVMHAIISRKHLELSITGNVLQVKDVGSTNGTYVFREATTFDIDSYLESHSLEGMADRTLDNIQEAFGPTLIDFLKTYSEKRGQSS